MSKQKKEKIIMATDVLLGLQWGDEGKGKIVDVLAENSVLWFRLWAFFCNIN